VLPWNERLHGVGVQVIMGLVHMHDGLVRFPAVASIVESKPSDVELQGGSSIAVAAVSNDRLNDELNVVPWVTPRERGERSRRACQSRRHAASSCHAF